jgi:DNA ligase-1
MDFNRLVEFYERIAATPKRLEIIEILSQMFIECKNPDNLSHLKKIVYLTQGQLVPEYEDYPKFGIAEKMIIQAMVKFTAKSADLIKQLINKKGDVGEAVQELLQLRTQQKTAYSLDAFAKTSTQAKRPELTIPKLYEELEKLAQVKGDKSQDTKMNIINALVRQCTPQSAKYVINIILSNLRIGIADMSILDGMAIAFTGSKENRPAIEYRYNIHPDLGEIAELLASKGLEAVLNIPIQVGIPIRMMAASRIPYQQIHGKLGGNTFIAEYKYDGERVQVHKHGDQVILYSRRLKQITDQYPDVIEAVRTKINAEDAIFEGEIVAMDPFFEKMLPFQIVSSRRRKYDVEKMVKEVPVCLYCFDLLYIKKNNSESPEEIMNKPLMERRGIFTQIIQKSERIQLSAIQELHTTEEMVAFFNTARAAGAEGIMCKSIGPESVYRAGNRGYLWIKLKGLEGAKMTDSIDVVVIGASWGKGRRKGFLSTLFGAVYNEETQKFEFLTRIGSGFSDEDHQKFTEMFKALEIEKPPRDVVCTQDTPEFWIKPQIILEIMGDELTISNKSDAGVTPDNPTGYSVRFPIFQRMREDKSVKEITTTQEILEMYEAQG